MSSSTRAWSSLDRKATAVAEFTLRQYRTRLSTWVVLSSCLVALGTVLLFYIDAMNDTVESVDNDGDGHWEGSCLEGDMRSHIERFPKYS